jgi:hypothetical protein
VKKHYRLLLRVGISLQENEQRLIWGFASMHSELWHSSRFFIRQDSLSIKVGQRTSKILDHLWIKFGFHVVFLAFFLSGKTNWRDLTNRVEFGLSLVALASMLAGIAWCHLAGVTTSKRLRSGVVFGGGLRLSKLVHLSPCHLTLTRNNCQTIDDHIRMYVWYWQRTRTGSTSAMLLRLNGNKRDDPA